METAIFNGRNVDGNIEFSDYNANKLYNEMIQNFLNEEKFVYETIARERGLNPVSEDVFGLFETTNYSNEEELKSLASAKFAEMGYKILRNGGVETPFVNVGIINGEDFGYDDLGDACSNIAIKMIVEYK